MSIMDLKGIVNKPKRNGFDLSENVSFTAKVGEILPVMVKEIIPGDKMKIDIRNFTRTVPVNTAAYTRIKEYYDVYFVPTRLLWNRFDSFITQMRNSQHANGLNMPDNSIATEHPYFTMRSAVLALIHGNNIFGYDRSMLNAKLLEYLGYSDMTRIVHTVLTNGETSLPSGFSNVKLNPFPLLAYQKIYQDYFRNDQWELPRPDFYNLDYIYSGRSPLIEVSAVSSRDSMFDLRYCNYKKDLFMGVMPNAQFSEADSFAYISTVDNIVDYRFTRGGQIANADVERGNLAMYNGLLQNSVSGQSPQNIDGIKLYTDNLGKLSVLALRQAEALQKWNEISQATKYDYKHQIESHWGVSVPNVRSGLCTYLGGYSSVIDIDGIDNTNITARENGTDVNKANIAGKGVGAGRGFIEFDSKDYGNEHGILMCVYHAIPELDYYPYGITPLNLKTEPTDYAIPELDSVGMQEVPMINLVFDEVDGDTSVGKYLGYAPRYYDYKTSIDTVKGAFLTSYQDWVAPLSREYLLNNVLKKNKLTYPFFKVNPDILYPIFGIQPDSTPETDTMLVNAMIDCKAVRNLDYNGLPY